MGEIGKRKDNDNNIASYKLCHASSSSGLSQSFAKEASLKIAVSDIFLRDLFSKNKIKSRTSPSIGSGTFLISFKIICFVVIRTILR